MLLSSPQCDPLEVSLQYEVTSTGCGKALRTGVFVKWEGYFFFVFASGNLKPRSKNFLYYIRRKRTKKTSSTEAIAAPSPHRLAALIRPRPVRDP